jgi:PAS domain S-box-containing protein
VEGTTKRSYTEGRRTPEQDSCASWQPGPGEEQQTFRDLIAGLKDYAVARLDLQGRVTGWNEGAEGFTGYTAEDVLGLEIGELLRTPHGARARLRRLLKTAVASGRSERKGWLARKDGSLILTRSIVTPVPDTSGRPTGFLIVTLATESTQDKDEIGRLAAALDVSQAIIAGQDPDAVLQLLPPRARVLVHADFAALFTPEPGGDVLVMRSTAGLKATAQQEARLPVSSTTIGRIFLTGRARMLRRIDIIRGRRRPAVLGRPVGPAVMVPLAAEGRKMGLLLAGNRNRGRPFQKKDVELLRLFAGQTAIAIQQAQMRRDRQRLAVLEERERLGRELHDGAIQSLYAVTLRLATTIARAEDSSLGEHLSVALEQIDSVILDLRNHIFELRPTALAGRNLDEALVQLVRDFELGTGISTTAEIDPRVAAQLAAHDSDLIQIVKEALSNVGRHAQPRSCKVSLRGWQGMALLVIEDDGVGFDPRQAALSGHGLRNLEERVHQLGGQFRVESARRAGTSVRIAIPLPPERNGGVERRPASELAH